MSSRPAEKEAPDSDGEPSAQPPVLKRARVDQMPSEAARAAAPAGLRGANDIRADMNNPNNPLYKQANPPAVGPDGQPLPAKKSMRQRKRERAAKQGQRGRRDARDLTAAEAAKWLNPPQASPELEAYYRVLMPALMHSMHETSSGGATVVSADGLDASIEGAAEAEFQKMLEAFRRPLPATFRLTPHTKDHPQLVAELESGELWETDGAADGMIPVPPFHYKRDLHLFQLKRLEEEREKAAAAGEGAEAAEGDAREQSLNTGRKMEIAPFENELAEAGIELRRVAAPSRVHFFAPGDNSSELTRTEVWGCELNKRELRDIPRLRKLHQWLVKNTDAGNVSRQELVSMIPPFFLDVARGQRVFDMCAAPGSKTVQILEWLDPGQRADELPTGVVIANDADSKRCYMLTRQTKRLNTPCCVVTNHEAQKFPNLRAEHRGAAVQFDRILADVPCSGDGTLRKNPELWQQWAPRSAMNLHGLQVAILLRGFNLLRPGGRIVYSTCSMNPVEDEAVIAEALRAWNFNAGRLHQDQDKQAPKVAGSKDGSHKKEAVSDDEEMEELVKPDIKHTFPVELVDCRNELPFMKRAKGISNWRVMDNGQHWFDTWDEVMTESEERQKNRPMAMLPPKDKKETTTEKNKRKRMNKANSIPLSRRLRASMFPPTPEEAEWMNLDRCMRVLPQMQDTGGFFIAVIQKGGTSEDANTIDLSLVKEKATADAFGDDWKYTNEAPWVPCLDHDIAAQALEEIISYYGLSDDFPRENCFTRSAKGNRITLVGDGVRDVLKTDWARGAADARLQAVNTGVLIFQRHERTKFDLECQHRISQDGLRWIWPYIQRGTGARVIQCTLWDFKLLVSETKNNLHTQYVALSGAMQARIAELSRGCAILRVEESDDGGAWSGALCACWLGVNTMHLLVPKEDQAILRSQMPANLEGPRPED